MTKFEYKFEVDLGTDRELGKNTEEELNELGREGWELVTVSPCGRDNACLGYWFKRPLN